MIAVAASGTTPFTLACLREAKRRGALTIGIANNHGTPILSEADCAIWLDTGPEPIAGSTRMKAGTAQRVALNLLSSLMMIRLGRVHEGLMVDLQAINAKLARRSENILIRLTGRTPAKRSAPRSIGPTAASSSRFSCCTATALMRRHERSIRPTDGCERRSSISATKPARLTS